MFYLLITPPSLEMGDTVSNDILGTVVDRSRNLTRLRKRQGRLLDQGDQRLGVVRTIVELSHRLNTGEQVRQEHLTEQPSITWSASVDELMEDIAT